MLLKKINQFQTDSSFILINFCNDI